ncbi:MAG: zinc ribbon domain-containing protein [bacterium]|nr:zinc ribbon domain-containing protein [bacterium]
MPIYNFKCNKCSHEFEELVAHRGDVSPCPKCMSKKVEKMISTPAPHVSKSSTASLPCADASCDYQPSCGCSSGSCPHH